jgi:hypothetical protein
MLGVIERIEDMPTGAIGFRGGGRITREEVGQVLLPPLNEVVTLGDPLRLVVIVEADLEPLEPRTLWSEVKAGVEPRLRHHGAWARTAVATDVTWVRSAVALLGWALPGQLRLLACAEVDEAKTWVLEEPQ